MQVSGLLLDLCVLLFFGWKLFWWKLEAMPTWCGWITNLVILEVNHLAQSKDLDIQSIPQRAPDTDFCCDFLSIFFGCIGFVEKSRNNLRSRYVPERGGCGFWEGHLECASYDLEIIWNILASWWFWTHSKSPWWFFFDVKDSFPQMDSKDIWASAIWDPFISWQSAFLGHMHFYRCDMWPKIWFFFFRTLEADLGAFENDGIPASSKDTLL